MGAGELTRGFPTSCEDEGSRAARLCGVLLKKGGQGGCELPNYQKAVHLMGKVNPPT